MAGIYQATSYALNAGGWALEEAEDHVTFTPADIDAALIISSFTKEAGAISSEDLRNMSAGGAPAVALRKPVTYGDFTGFRAEYDDPDATHWRVYWLAHDRTHLYITYNCHIDYVGRHDAVVDWMLSTLTAGASAA